MGSLIGHIVPGTAFTIVALWWTFYYLRRYFEARLRGTDIPFHASTIYAQRMSACDLAPTFHRCNKKSDDLELGQAQSVLNGKNTTNSRQITAFVGRRGKFPPWELSFRLVVITIGMMGEYVTALDEHWHFKTVHNAQHMTMFGFFLLPTVVELMYHYGVPWMPRELDIIAGSIAFGAEGVLFVWHLHGRTAIDVQVHTFLVYAIVLCFVATLLEIFFPRDIRPAMLRSTFTLLQGTWFYFVGFILYPPDGWAKWKDQDHHEMMYVTMMFTWNVAAIVVGQMLIAMIVYRSTKRRLSVLGVTRMNTDVMLEKAGLNHLQDTTSQTTRLIDDDDDD